MRIGDHGGLINRPWRECFRKQEQSNLSNLAPTTQSRGAFSEAGATFAYLAKLGKLQKTRTRRFSLELKS
jgi:hypothetical protein